MKILHILNELKPSGGETMLSCAASLWLKDNQHDILSTGVNVGTYATVLAQCGYRIHHLPFNKNLEFFASVRDLIREGQYDILHIHTERAAPFYAIVAHLAAPRNSTIFRTVHHLFRYDGILRWRKRFERQFMKRVLGVTFLSNSPSGMVNERLRYGLENTYAPNWYDSKTFVARSRNDQDAARITLGWKDTTTVFVSLGGNWPYKNYDHIIRALRLIPESLDFIYVQIGVQGSGSPLETLAAELGVSHRLHCAGIVDNVLPLLHGADAYLMPSSEEGFGIAAVEAMAVGLPAILGEVEALTDFREIIGKLCYVTPQPRSIASAMEAFIHQSRESLFKIGLQHAQDVKQHFSLDVGPLIYLEQWHKKANE